MSSGPHTALGGLRLPCKTSVLLRLKADNSNAGKMKYKVKDRQTLVVGGNTDDTDSISSSKNLNLSIFTFDEVFDINSDDNSVIGAVMKTNIEDVLDGFNVSIMAYGQSNTRKTTLLFGNRKQEGVVGTTSKELFQRIEGLTKEGLNFTISASFIEVYAERVHDLLSDPKTAKSLKISTTSNASVPVTVKGLRTVFVATLDEFNFYLASAKEHFQKEGKSSRSNVLIQLHILQTDEIDETIKSSTLLFVDLAGSDKLEKSASSEFSPEDIKKINLSMYSLDNVARSLAALETSKDKTLTPSQLQKNIPYHDSHLTRLLREVLGGNSKTTIILTCSIAQKNQEDTLNTLDFGANMVLARNSVEKNKSGLNSKRIMDISIKNMSLRESNYLYRIKMLEDELVDLKAKVRTETTSEKAQREMLSTENNTLKSQLASLTQLFKSVDIAEKGAKEEKIQSDILGTIMEKCEIIMDLQVKLDNEVAKNKVITKELNYKSSKEEALEATNLRLLEQIQESEEELKSLLVSNSFMKDSMEKWLNLANTRLDSIKALEKSLKELSKQDTQSKRRSSGSSNGSTMVQIDENSSNNKGTWFFGNTTASVWGTRKASTDSSAMTIGSQESLKVTAPKVGLNLRVVRPTDDSKNDT